MSRARSGAGVLLTLSMFMVLSVKLSYEILWPQNMWLISIQYSCRLLFTLYVPVI